MPMTFGTWASNHKSPWEEKLDYMSDYKIEKIGMNRKQLTKILKYLEEQNVIR